MMQPVWFPGPTITRNILFAPKVLRVQIKVVSEAVKAIIICHKYSGVIGILLSST
jgi:hypothetical protein